MLLKVISCEFAYIKRIASNLHQWQSTSGKAAHTGKKMWERKKWNMIQKTNATERKQKGI